MLFLRIEIDISEITLPIGPITGEESLPSPEQMEQRRQARRLGTQAELFHQKSPKEGYLFVADRSEDKMVLGFFSCSGKNPAGYIGDFMDELNLGTGKVEIHETTFAAVRKLLSTAYRNGYVSDDDEILEELCLDALDDGYLRPRFQEHMIKGWKRSFLYKTSERFLTRDSLREEFERIYQTGPQKGSFGHPVHYLIRANDYTTRNETVSLLLNALYEQGRIISKRYCTIPIYGNKETNYHAVDMLFRSCMGGVAAVYHNGDLKDEQAYADSLRGTIDMVSTMIKKYRSSVLTLICVPKESENLLRVFRENLANITFVEIQEKPVGAAEAKEHLSLMAEEKGVTPDELLFSGLDGEKTYDIRELEKIFCPWYDRTLKTKVYPQYRHLASTGGEAAKEKPKGNAWAELDEMIGLARAKQVIKMALDYQKVRKLYRDKGVEDSQVSMHMVFTGNPGTAKTTVARLYARIMKENGFLSRGHLVEVGRGDLVDRYVGWTAGNVQKKFKEAMGGVLFIDEAYSLLDDRDGSFGDEAINTIVQEMENARQDLVVIFAGYPDKMEQFLQKNPGLRSRIACHVPFEDYSSEELVDITELMAKKKGISFTEQAIGRMSRIYDTARREKDFGNGRYARNLLEKAQMTQAGRILTMDFETITQKELLTICEEDIEIPETGKPVRTIGFRVGGLSDRE